MMKNLFKALLLLGLCSVFIDTAAGCVGHACPDNPDPCCYVWPMSIIERKMLSPFCDNGQICYILDEMANSWTKCFGYCNASETLPGRATVGVNAKCHTHECRCCRPTKIEKMEVCVVCCRHPICQGRRSSLLGPGGSPGGDQYSGRGGVPSRAEVERLAKQQQAGDNGRSPLAPRWPFWPPVATTIPPWRRPPTQTPRLPWWLTTRPTPRPRPTTRRPPPPRPQHNLPGKHLCCPAWARMIIFDIPRDCDCKPCV